MSDCYTLLNKGYQPTQSELTIIANYRPFDEDSWSKNIFSAYKKNIKDKLLLGQFDRCAYCRKIIEADGKYEPLEHIVAQTRRREWIFEPNNLILTCDSCNNLKGAEQVLTDLYVNSNDLPMISAAYKIFNPHYDTWSHHLVYEDNLFLTAVVGSKGAETIRICKLYRYNTILNRSKELKMGQKTPMGKILHRLSSLDVNSADAKNILEQLLFALNHYKERMEDIDGY